MEKRVTRDNLLVLVFGLVFLFSIIMVFNQGIRTTGFATTSTTTSNVTIHTYFAIDMSANLSDGIAFGNITSLPAVDQNATHNYDGVAATFETAPGTSMWMNVSDDSNSPVDFCIMADELNTSSGDVIVLANETYHFNETGTNLTQPTNGSEISLTDSYVKAGTAVAVGGENYYRFWLDVPAAIASGTYNNTVYFKGVTTGGSC